MISLSDFFENNLNFSSIDEYILESESGLDWNILTKLYSIFSPTYDEDKIIKFISHQLELIDDIIIENDSYGNIYVTKGNNESYPCLISHLDQRQKSVGNNFKIIKNNGEYSGKSDRGYEGLGADDKNGIFLCLEALKNFDVLKVIFLKDEETKEKGSKYADLSFFDNCRYVLDIDRKGNSDFVIMSKGIELCSQEFVDDIIPIQFGYNISLNGLTSNSHTLKKKGLDKSIVLISCGYYSCHTRYEKSNKKDIVKCWNFIKYIINHCKKIYYHKNDKFD